ncbi:MAG: ATP-binding cassette domain-containing protein [Candidatus Eisenbacteria bacterium]|nr:ATP-binding cassette domain-containing protein [Candidatus Latescibacterota bacterium]MBD3302860.1 ATP-binding cassette domain-containing protein [Candidatus Eisenbacteria bacterium]
MLRTHQLRRVYRLGGAEIRALDGVDLEIRDGEYLRVIGSSGSGKSTLLNLLAGLDRPTEGRIETPAGDLGRLSRKELAAWRSRQIGMVFQTFNLIPHRTALQNVELGMLFAGLERRERIRRATEMLEQLGLAGRLNHRPADLSGGEQQRVALARAMAKGPRLLLADEPTGNLDRENAEATAGFLREMSGRGVTIVLVTHDAGLATDDVHRTVRMDYGRIVDEEERA